MLSVADTGHGMDEATKASIREHWEHVRDASGQPFDFAFFDRPRFVYDTEPPSGRPLTTHQWYDGTQHPWEFARVWHLEPSLDDPDTVYAGVEDAALFRSTDGGQTTDRARPPRPHAST